jgi:hypothetical protein
MKVTSDMNVDSVTMEELTEVMKKSKSKKFWKELICLPSLHCLKMLYE